MARTSRRRWARFGALATLTMVIGLILAACGGDSAGTAGEDYPVFAGATRLDSAKLSTDDMPIDAKGAGSAVFVSQASFADVAAYYESGIAAEGWTVSDSPASVADMISIQSISKGSSVAMVTVMASDFAGQESAAGMFDAADVDIDVEDFPEAGTVIVILHFTCEEADVLDCVNAMAEV